MSHSIFITSPTALIAQPGRAVNTFPSGLVRVDQVYLGLTSQAATHRATLAIGNNMPDGNSSPCIDGLKIFPEVQERRRSDGFTEFIVSAYGRVNTTGKSDTNLAPGSFVVSNPNSGPGSLIGLTSSECFLLQTTIIFTAPSSSVFSTTFSPTLKAYAFNNATSQVVDISTEENFLSAFPASIVTAVNGNSSTTEEVNQATITLTKTLSNLTKTKYGAFDEITAVLDTQMSVFLQYIEP